MSFENLLFFFKILPRHTLYMRYPFGHLYGKNLLSPFSKQKQAHIGCFSFESPSKLKRKYHTSKRIFLEDAPVLALKISKNGVGWGCI